MADDKAGEETATGEQQAIEARRMLDAFASVGATAFDVTLTDIEGKKLDKGYQPGRSLGELRRTIGLRLQSATQLKTNVIIRPRSIPATLIQLDDLQKDQAARIAPHSFIVFQTSPGNYQAWVAVEKAAKEDFSRRLRKGAGADATASGATRIAGSHNFKTKYAPDFPRVEITANHPGNVTNMVALEQAGFVAPREEPKPPRPLAATERYTASGRLSRKKWPSYQFCVQHAPLTHGEERPDISRADFTWCRTAREWGWTVPETASRLMELSSKARENGERYAKLTAERAAASVDRQPYRETSTPRPG